MGDVNDDHDHSSISTGSLHSIENEDFFEYSDPCYYTSLYVACAENDVARVSQDLQKGKVEINQVDNKGNTYLHIALLNDSIDVVKLLLEVENIRIDVQNHEGNTPLHIAQSTTALKYIIDAGAELDIQNNFLKSPLMHHFSRNNYENGMEYAKILLKSGADPNLFGCDNLPLFCKVLFRRDFSEREQIEWVSMLLYYGGDVNLKYSSRYDSPFMCVMRELADELIDLMMPFVTDFNEVSENSYYSLLMFALSRGSYKALTLIEHRADINYATSTASCLSLSLVYRHPRLFQYLWNQCDKSKIFQKQKLFLYFYFTTNYFNTNHFISNLYTILSSEYAVDLVEEWIPFGMYNRLFQVFNQLDIQRSHRVAIIYTFLTLSNKILAEDLFEVYEHFGFNEELEAFMVVNMEILNFVPHLNFVTCLCCPYYSIEDGKRTNQVKSLMQISRDAVRKNLRRPVGNTYFQYYNEVMQLQIPQILKDIICLKRTIEPQGV